MLNGYCIRPPTELGWKRATRIATNQYHHDRRLRGEAMFTERLDPTASLGRVNRLVQVMVLRILVGHSI
jgi:hypothetical protein